MSPQCLMLLTHFDECGSITSDEARGRYGIARCASRINELRKAGYDIRTEMEKGVNRFGDTVRYGRYFLRRNPE